MVQEEHLVAGRARGEDVYRRYAPEVFAYLLRHVPTHQDAEDLLIEVFLVILEKTSLLNLDERELAAFVKGVARNKMADYYRQRGKRQLIPLEAIEKTAEVKEQSPEQRVLSGEQLADLRLALDALPEQQQLLLRLRFIHGLRCGEIATHLGRSENAVRVMLSRTLSSLRKHSSSQEERS